MPLNKISSKIATENATENGVRIVENELIEFNSMLPKI